MQFYYDPSLDVLQAIVENRAARSRKALLGTLIFFAVAFSIGAYLSCQ